MSPVSAWSGILFISASLLWPPMTSIGGEPLLEKSDLFVAGQDGYALYHIPGLVVTEKGTVLVCCEARKKGSDWDSIDILLRRSTDDGRTFSPARRLAHVAGPKTKNPAALKQKSVAADDVTYNNPVLIAGGDDVVHALFCLEYLRVFYIRSIDDGMTWSTPREITEAFDKFRTNYDWKVLATGPNHGIQLRNGRLIVPVWLSTGVGNNSHHPSVAATIYSDNDGQSWYAGDIAVPCTEELIDPNETVGIELADGSVMLNVRNESRRNRRLVTISPDGASRWSTPRFDDALLEPICMAGITRLSLAATSDKNRILFCNPDNLDCARGKIVEGKSRDRKNLSIKLSYDEGQTWAFNKTVEAGPSAYSDIGVSPRGTILCFYGRGQKLGFAGDRLTLARCNLEWITDQKDVLPATTTPVK